MEHILFKTVSVLFLLILISLAGLYDIFGNTSENIKLKLILKSCPMIILIILNLFYFIFYRLTLYSILMGSFLFFCLIGDIFMCLYNPVNHSETVFLLLGGGFFFLSRFVLVVIFSTKPYKTSIIHYPFKKTLISHFIFELPFIGIGILLLVYKISLISIFMFIYLILGFGLPMSISFLRIGELKDNYDIEESKISSIFAFIGITLFNVSDVMLLLTMSGFIPSICILISDNIYWLGMYFLTISIVRSSSEHIEKGLDYFPPYLTTAIPDF